MESFKDAFCRKFDCRPEDFVARVFCASVYPHVRLFAWFGAHRARPFAPDRALVEYCGILGSPRDIAAELNEFARLPENRRFARKVLLIRISGRRLIQLAHACFPSPASTEGASETTASATPFREPLNT